MVQQDVLPKRSSQQRPKRMLAILSISALAAFTPAFTGPHAPTSRSRGSCLSRYAAKGREVEDDTDMMKKIREWKKTKGFASASPSGTATTKPFQQEAPSPPQPVPAPVKAAAAPPREPARQPEKHAAPEPPPSPVRTKMPTAQDAIAELLRRAKEDALPDGLTPQQLIMIFLTFFSGWRERNGIPGSLDLTLQQKQLVVLLIQSNLSMVNSAKDFWPQLCAELAGSRDPEVKDLLVGLTGLH